MKSENGETGTRCATIIILPSAFLPPLARCSSKVSEMYLRKMRPRTTCLYSAVSMLFRSLSAVSQSLASKPRLAGESALGFAIGAILNFRKRCLIPR